MPARNPIRSALVAWLMDDGMILYCKLWGMSHIPLPDGAEEVVAQVHLPDDLIHGCVADGFHPFQQRRGCVNMPGEDAVLANEVIVPENTPVAAEDAEIVGAAAVLIEVKSPGHQALDVELVGVHFTQGEKFVVFLVNLGFGQVVVQPELHRTGPVFFGDDAFGNDQVGEVDVDGYGCNN
jgi:hypothetical protein